MLSEDETQEFIKKLRGKWEKRECDYPRNQGNRGFFSSFGRSQRITKMSNAAEKSLWDLEISSVSCADRKGDRY